MHQHEQVLSTLHLPVLSLGKHFFNQGIQGTATGRLFTSGFSEHCLSVLSTEEGQ